MVEQQKNEILIYQAEDGSAVTEVRLGEETVWLSQVQIAELFGRERSVITKHINNVFKEGELEKESNVQNLHIAGSDKPVRFFSLDVIISVGYRVKSIRGTQFRIWANKVLKDYLIRGYALNKKRLQEQNQKLADLRSTVSLLEKTLAHQAVGEDEAKGLLKVIADYAYALTTLDRYDHGSLEISATSEPSDFMLYFVVKNHAFSDGNKRIAAAIFLCFMAGHGILYQASGGKRIADNALVALTLLIAESRPVEKETIVKLVINLINGNNQG